MTQASYGQQTYSFLGEVVLDGAAQEAGHQLGPDGGQGMCEAVPCILPAVRFMVLGPLQLPLVLVILHIQPGQSCISASAVMKKKKKKTPTCTSA